VVAARAPAEVTAIHRPFWRARSAASAGAIAAALLALVAASGLGGTPPAAAAAAAACPAPAPSGTAYTNEWVDEGPNAGPDHSTPAFGGPLSAPLAKPAATVGLTQTIFWNPEPASYWDYLQTYASPPPTHLGGYAYIVNITNESTCQTKAIDVPGGQSADQFTVSGSDFPAAADAIDGTTFAYRLSTVYSWCDSETTPGSVCGPDGTKTSYSDQTTAVTSLQDATSPVLASFSLGNAPLAPVDLHGSLPPLVYTNKLTVPVHLVASDPEPSAGGAASGVGYVQFSPTATFSCAASSVCVSPFAPTTSVTLPAGPDGPRTVYARVFDMAQAPTWKPPPTVGLPLSHSGLPAGNASNVLSATIELDTAGPKLVVTAAPQPGKVGKPVTFDASHSSDPPIPRSSQLVALGEPAVPGPGINPATAAWNFGDGTTASGLTVTHAYAHKGTYTVTFSLADRIGNVSTTQITVKVKHNHSG
jgi:hypothetical protein